MITSEELIINGVKVDVSQSIPIHYESFLSTGFVRLEQQRTWTVSLPRTQRNIAAIEGANTSDYHGVLPYRVLTAEYYINSVAIIEDGKCTVLRTTANTFEVVIIWGKLSTIMSSMSTKTLDEMNISESVEWNRDSVFPQWFNFTNLDRTYTTHPDVPQAVTHPSVTLSEIILWIEDEFDVVINDLLDYDRVNELAIPLRRTDGISPTPLSYSISPIVAGVNDLVQFTQTQPSHLELQFSGSRFVLPEDKVKEAVQIEVNIQVATTTGSPSTQMDLLVDGISIETAFDSSAGAFELYVINKTFTLQPGSWFSFEILGRNTLSFGALSTCDITISHDIAYYGGRFPLVQNLPKISCSDFLFNMAMLVGVLPYNDIAFPDWLRFFPPSRLQTNIATASDWSNRIIKSTAAMNEPEDMEFTFGEYQRLNTISYANDLGGGVIQLDNENFDKSYNIAKLRFAFPKAFSETNTIIDYPLYDISVVLGQLIRRPLDVQADVLALLDGGFLRLPPTFLDIFIEENYVAFAKILNYPRVITERFILTTFEGLKIDVTKPVYIKQYGKYYAILEADFFPELAEVECKLIELK